MFLSFKNYLDQVQQLTRSSRNLDLAVAFWGDGAEKIFNTWQGDRLRIVCNLKSGGTNPHVIRRLQDIPGVQVRSLDRLHAKVMVGESAALIGSANFSANGLGFEGNECSGWCEAGMFTIDSNVLDDVQTWYEVIWNEAIPVRRETLQEAEENWRKHRDHRPALGSSKRLVTQPATVLRDREIYLAIYWEHASKRAHQTFTDVQRDLELSDEVMRRGFDFFEDWPDDGDNALPASADIIMTYYGPNGGIKVQNAWVRDVPLDRASIKILRKRCEVADWSFSRQDQDLLAKRLKPWLIMLNDKGFFDNGARCVALYKFLLWEERNMERNH
ncbi:phospholipase D-like domain-containing protein [Pseudomonas fulva]|uniref:phospholipase D-like domain-containing protein n=1 Tax=Pseudomonas fulva TaxID=47880 RepID=UPI000D9B7EDC|nr:phospholipase D-like domain-containing protein [Pseudomonas fulva]PYB83637.1 hypothetical protein DMX01_21930 [Pseudomonas fulva]PYC09072.1 hypothetical protein DMX00_21835 [Pseudomonas fulva]